MLAGVERLVDLTGPRVSGLTGIDAAGMAAAVHAGDLRTLEATDGHVAAVSRDGQTVRMARTIGLPLRYFVAKMFHGPFLVVGDRIDGLYEWCRAQKIGWQFDPLYTRMVPAHYLVEIEQIGCPDPNPRYRRFFEPPVGGGPADPEELGAGYVGAAHAAVRGWLAGVPEGQPVAVLFSGGVDSTSVLLLARAAQSELGRDPDLIRPFTLDLGGGADAAQAERAVRELGIAHTWEALRLPDAQPDLEAAIAVIEDYHPLDVECAAAGLLALGEIRRRHPALRYLLDGDGGDENLKSYPLEDSDLTLSSVLRNPLLYQEGWGLEAIKHSLTYSGGLSRSYVRTLAPAARQGFEAFSPYTVRSVIAASLRIPFETLLAGSAERLYSLKAEVVRAGVQAATGIDMPVFPKRRFQEGAGDSYRRWRVSKSWCRQVFLRQWEGRLRESWALEAERQSGNAVPLGVG
jgi:asparagine synthase (glutamine-hydrolysing)